MVITRSIQIPEDVRRIVEIVVDKKFLRPEMCLLGFLLPVPILVAGLDENALGSYQTVTQGKYLRHVEYESFLLHCPK
jgi:hypothetical protein